MTSQLDHHAEPTGRRPVGGTEYSWCKAVPAGTGITVLALLLSKPPDIQILQNALHKLQRSHPILRSKLHFDATANTFSFVTQPSPYLQIQQFDLSSTADGGDGGDEIENFSIPAHQVVIEHEINKNPWIIESNSGTGDTELFFVSSYALSETRWLLALRLHTGACDRASAVALLGELLELVCGDGKDEGGKAEVEVGLGLGIEEYIPSGKANKPFWARGKDMLGYSLNALRTASENQLLPQIPLQQMKMVKHPNIVELHEVMASKSKIYIAMELVRGGELFSKNGIGTAEGGGGTAG